MARSLALAGGLLAVVLAMAVVAVHSQAAPAASPEPSGSASPWSAPSKAPSGAPTAMEMESLSLAPAKAPALGRKANAAGAPQEDSPTAAPALATLGTEWPEESPGGAPQIALVPAAAAGPQEYGSSMAPAFAPLGSETETPEHPPAGAPWAEAEAPGPSSEMAAAPYSEDYDVLSEEALAPAGENPTTTEAAVSGSPAEAPGPASADDASDAASATPTRRGLAAAALLAAVWALAAL